MAGKARCTKVASEMYKVQFDTRTTRAWVLPLLRRIEAGDYPSKAARIIGLSRQHACYYLKKLEEAGLVYREKRSNVAFYSLTARSTNLLRSCEGRVYPGELHRLDKCQVSFGIVSEGRYPEGSFKRVEMVNWTALLGLELGVKVRHTSRSWIVHVPMIHGRNPAEVYGLAMNLANRVAVALSKKYGVVLSEGRFVAGELAVEDPVAQICGRYFTVRTAKRKIDHSWNEGELENLSKDAVVAYLQVPEKVKSIEVKLSSLERSLKELASRLCDALGALQDDTVSLAEGQRRMEEYVS